MTGGSDRGGGGSVRGIAGMLPYYLNLPIKNQVMKFLTSTHIVVHQIFLLVL